MPGSTGYGRRGSANMAGNESGFLRTDKFVRDLDRQLDNLLGEGGSFDDLTPEQQKVVLANINDPNYNSEETEERVIGDDNLNIPPQSGPGMRRPESPFDSETDRRGFGDAPGSILGTNSDAGENWGGQLESRLFDSRGNPIDAGMVSSTDTDQPIRPDNPLAPKPPSPRDSGTMVDPQKDLSHYFESDELIRRAIENGSLPLDQLTDEQQKALKVGPYAVDPKLEGSENARDAALDGLEGDPVVQGEVPLTPEEETRKQEILDGTSSGDIDVTTLSKEELEALGIDPADLDPALTTQMKERLGDMGQKVKDAFGEVVEFGKGVLGGLVTSPDDLLQDVINNSLGTRVGVKYDGELGKWQFEIFIGLPIPGLTGEGLTIDITDETGQIVLDDNAKEAIKKVYDKAKAAIEELPDKIEEKLEGFFEEIEKEGGEIESAEQDEEGNILVKIKDAAGKVITKILSPLEIIGIPTGSKGIGTAVGKSLALYGIGSLLSRNNDGGGSPLDIGQEGPFGSAPDEGGDGNPLVSDTDDDKDKGPDEDKDKGPDEDKDKGPDDDKDKGPDGDEDKEPGSGPPDDDENKPPLISPDDDENKPPLISPDDDEDKPPPTTSGTSGTLEDIGDGGSTDPLNTSGDTSDSGASGTLSDISNPNNPIISGPTIPPDGGDGGDGGNPFFSIPGSPQPGRRNQDEEEDDEFVPFYFGDFENIYNPVDIVVNPEAREQFSKVGIESLGVRDSVISGLVQENKKTQNNLDRLKERAKDMGKPKNKPMQMNAARGGLVPPSFPDRLNQIMGYR